MTARTKRLTRFIRSISGDMTDSARLCLACLIVAVTLTQGCAGTAEGWRTPQSEGLTYLRAELLWRFYDVLRPPRQEAAWLASTNPNGGPYRDNRGLIPIALVAPEISSAVIRIEDKSETAISANGTYAGTSATIAQVLAHEIGHALGLGDTGNGTSIESYFLDSNNSVMSSQDIDAIRMLYSPILGNGPYVSDTVKAAVAALASFAPAGAEGAIQLVGVGAGGSGGHVEPSHGFL
jgi:hypothetical protein